MTPLDLWYFRLDPDTLATPSELDKRDRKLVDKAIARAGQRTNLGAGRSSPRWWTAGGSSSPDRRSSCASRPRTSSGPATVLEALLDEYLSTLPPNRRTLFRRYTVVDVARKVVGVGSVGTRCLIVLLLADDDQPLFMQMKEAGPSVLEAHLGPSEHAPGGPARRDRAGGDPGGERRVPRLGSVREGRREHHRLLLPPAVGREVQPHARPACRPSSSTPTAACAAPPWRGPTPAPATRPPSPGTSATTMRSPRRSLRTPRVRRRGQGRLRRAARRRGGRSGGGDARHLGPLSGSRARRARGSAERDPGTGRRRLRRGRAARPRARSRSRRTSPRRRRWST